MSHEPHRLYEFLPADIIGASGSAKPWELVPGLSEGIQHLAKLVISEEVTKADSPWETRFHTYTSGRREVSDDAKAAASNYLTHLGSATVGSHRTFEFDRPLDNCSTGASNLRLGIDAPAGTTKSEYTYTLTTYTPQAASSAAEANQPFDQEEYEHVLALIEAGELEAWEAEQEAKRANIPPPTEPLAPIHHKGISSQFVFKPYRQDGQPAKQSIYTNTFKANARHDWSARVTTRIDAPPHQLEVAYALGYLPRVTPSQALARQQRGAPALVHLHLSGALRHLASR